LCDVEKCPLPVLFFGIVWLHEEALSMSMLRSTHCFGRQSTKKCTRMVVFRL
jgi:hypothetical protein